MSQKAEILFDAITGIREDLVEEAQRHVFCRRARWRRYGGLAACLVLYAGPLWRRHGGQRRAQRRHK